MKRVLVVEDSMTCAGLLEAQLQQIFGEVEVISSDDPQSALLRLATDDFDLLILDLMLPGSPPSKTLEDFSAVMKRLPAVVVTGVQDVTGQVMGRCTTELFVACMRAGADSLIPKDQLSLEFLRTAVRLAILENRVEQLAEHAGLSIMREE